MLFTASGQSEVIPLPCSALDSVANRRKLVQKRNDFMNPKMKSRPLVTIASLTVLVLSAMSLAAQNSTTLTTTPDAAGTASATQTAPVQLPYGAADILKLSRAKVSDDITVSFIENSGTVYSLSAPQIVYLREQGVSDRVLAAMLNQRKRVTDTAAQVQAAAASAPANNSYANNAQSAPTYEQPSTAYVQTAPASTVYVIPNSSPTYTYYDYYPYYPYYGGYYYGWPALSFSFGYGGYYNGYHGGYYGGYHGGYYGGGGWHGGWHGGGGGWYGGWHGGGGHH